MKRWFLFAAALLLVSTGIAQTNYTGDYGYSYKPPFKLPKGEAGPTGSLSLLKIGENTYKFWLDISKGYPSYNMGSARGTITIKGDSAVYDNTYEGSPERCIFTFKFKKDLVVIGATSTEANCGFGHGVYADGDYKKAKKQSKINNEWLKKQYSGMFLYEVRTQRSVIYEDNELNKSKNQYFIKGDILIAVDETDTAVYTEFIAANGKFIFGWLKKSDLVLKE